MKNIHKDLIVDSAKDFLSLKSIGIIGVSKNKSKFGNIIFKELKDKKYNIFQIHNSEKSLNSDFCYATLEDIPEKVEGIIINVKSEKVIPIIEKYREYGVDNFWIQKGSHSDETIKYCNEYNINSIQGKCVLMFAEPVTSIHKFHKIIWNWFGI